MSHYRIYENHRTTTAKNLDAALKQLGSKYALTEGELEYLEDGETVIWEEGAETVEIVIIEEN